MNINDEIEKATQAYLESDKLKEHIQVKAEKMINELVDDSFGYFGGIKKTVEEAMKDEIHINIKELGLSGFNTFITDVIKEKLNKSMRAEAEKRIGEEMEKILTPIDKVVSIQTLKEELLAAADTHDLFCGNDVTLDMLDGNGGYGENDVFTLLFNKPDNDKYKWVTIYVDTEPNKKEYECEYVLSVHKNFTSFKQQSREIKATDKVMNRDYGFEDFIYRMYLNGSTIDYEEARREAVIL
jgi:hypothetical protein